MPRVASAPVYSDQQWLAAAFRVRPLAERVLTSTLCLASSAHKPATPLVKQAMRILRELVLASAEPVRSHNRMR